MLNIEIASTEKLLSIALATTRATVERYSVLAGTMRQYDNDEACDLFISMADQERAHETQLSEWARLEGLPIETNIEPVTWQDPRVATTYDADARDPNQTSPYKILAFAVHNKERAFRFYSYAAASSGDSDVRRYAETLAREALRHAALLRTRRRRAWHEQRKQGNVEPIIGSGIIQSTSSLLATTVYTEKNISDTIDTLSDAYPALKMLAISTRKVLSQCEQSSHEADAPNAEVTRVLSKMASWRALNTTRSEEAPAVLRQLCGECDRSFAFYDAVVTSADDEDVLLLAQRLSVHALERIAALRRVTDGVTD